MRNSDVLENGYYNAVRNTYRISYVWFYEL